MFHSPLRASPPAGRRRAASLLPRALLLAAVLSPLVAAQQSQAEKDALIDKLLKELAAERAAREALAARVAALEAARPEPGADELEEQLKGLVAPGDLQAAPARPPSSPAFYNPAIGVYMDAVAEGGNFDQRFGEDSDKFSLRETEIDMRLPLSPFAEGVGIFAFENQGDNEFEATIEEGYANLGLGTMFDWRIDTTAKLGRFRPMFGRNNQLHTHDWLQVEQPVAVRNLLGDEGVVGEGVMFHQPLAAWQAGGGRGRALSLDLSLVNGELLDGEETALGEAAGAAGLSLGSDDPMYVARLSQFSELGAMSDLEFGVSAMGPLGADALLTDTGERVTASYLDADVTWRSRREEHGVGSWLLQAEALRAYVDDHDAGMVANGRDSGWWFTAQHQISPTVYIGLLYGMSDVLESEAEDTSISPYLTWYADEFFRIRAEYEHLTRDGHGSEPDVSDGNRFQLQFTWNFGVHAPHPYWVNR